MCRHDKHLIVDVCVCVGAEGGMESYPDLPPKYLVQIDVEESFDMIVELANTWGMVSGAEVDVYIRYEVVYR